MEFTRSIRIGAFAFVLALCGGVGVAAALVGPADASASAARGAGSQEQASGEGAGSEQAVSDAAVAQAAAEAPDRTAPADPPAPVAVDAAVQKQLAYVLTHWDDYNLDEYGQLGTTDCVNFASQSLIARGWEMDEQWWTEGTGADFSFSSPWVSSTAFMRYLDESGRATALTDDQRAQVKVGDIAQFDWDNSGDRDHTGVVTRVEGSGENIQIFYGGHTEDTDYRSVDFAITEKHPGGTAYYWSIP